MKNPYAARWTTFGRGEDPGEKAMINYEAAEAEAMPTEKCGNCGDAAFYRPGVGAYQCGYCRSLLISKVVDGKVVEKWVE